MGKKAIIETILRPLGLGVYRLRTSSYEKNFLDAALAYKRLLVRDILKKTGYRVARGPFEGLWLPEEGAWSDYDVLAKIVGSYEAEIFFALEEEVARKPSIIVNIGASEGYYAIGMKRRVGSRMKCDLRMMPMVYQSQGRCNETHLLPPGSE